MSATSRIGEQLLGRSGATGGLHAKAQLVRQDWGSGSGLSPPYWRSGKPSLLNTQTCRTKGRGAFLQVGVKRLLPKPKPENQEPHWMFQELPRKRSPADSQRLVFPCLLTRTLEQNPIRYAPEVTNGRAWTKRFMLLQVTQTAALRPFLHSCTGRVGQTAKQHPTRVLKSPRPLKTNVPVT